MKFKNYLLILITISFLIFPVNAETGTLTIDASTTNTYTQVFSSTSGGVTFNWSRMFFDSATYNHITDILITFQSSWAFAHEAESTSFTIVSGGAGTGTATYNKNSRTVYFYFNNANITSSPVIIVYAKNVLANVTNGVQHGGTPGFDVPVFFGAISDGAIAGCPVAAGSQCTFQTTTSTTFSNNYDVTYSSVSDGTLTNVSIDKTPSTVNSKIKISNSTAVIYQESTFNTASFSYVFLYSTGLYLNMSDSVGNYDIVLVNSSGTIVPTPTPIGGGGSSSGQIYFDFTNATPGVVYGINASISDANFSSFDTYYIDVFDPTGTEITGFPTSFGTQTFSTGRFYYFDKFGTYTANLSYCSFMNPLCPSIISPTFLDTASLTVNQVALTYNITTDKANYQSGDNVYINATNPGLTKAYITVTNNGGIVTDIAWNSEVAPNSVKNITAVISNNLPLGRYLVSLADNPTYHVVSQVMFNITAIPSTPNTLGLGWAFPPFGIYITGNTGVLTYTSNMNASTVSIYSQGANQNLLLEKSFVASAPNTTGNYSQTFNKPGIWYAKIVDNNDATNFLWSNTTVNDANPTDPDGQKLCKSKENYVCWDKHEYYQGDAYIVNYKLVVPSVITYYPTIKIYDPSDNVVKTVKLNYSIWNNTITGAISGKFSTSAKTGIWFVKAEKINQITGEDNGEIANSAASVIGRNVSAGATPPSGDAAVAGAGNNLRTLISQPFFWGLVILALILYGIRHTQVVKEVAIFVIFVEDVVGLFAPYTIFILIGLIIYAAISFRSGKQIVTGE